MGAVQPGNVRRAVLWGILLATVELRADGQPIDFSEAVVVVSPGDRGQAEKMAATILVEEVAQRTNIVLPVQKSWPSGGQPVIAIMTRDRKAAWSDRLPGALREDLVPPRLEGFAIQTTKGRHSSGADGAMWIGMRNSDVFGAVYSTAGHFFTVTQPNARVNLSGDIAVFSDFILDFTNVSDPAVELASVQSPADLSDSNFANLYYSFAAFHSPNLNTPEFYSDLPFELPSLEVIPDVRDRWLEHDQFQLLEEHASDLSSLRGLGLKQANTNRDFRRHS